VVWVIFDELSYNQVFEHRAHDLTLPHFDALKQMSTVFTNVQPVGYRTVKIVPSLLTGKVVDDYRFRFNNSFVVHEEGVPDGSRCEAATVSLAMRSARDGGQRWWVGTTPTARSTATRSTTATG
jgi:hypothetical protein